MYVIHYITFFYFLQLCSAFLLDPTQQSTDKTYVSLTKFLESQKYLEASIEHLRKTTEDTNAVLVKQLNQKMLEIANQINVNGTTISPFLDNTDKKYQSLEHNYTLLMKSFKELQKVNFDLTLKLDLLTNKTDANEREVVELKQLKNIQAIQDLQTLKQNVQKIDAQTNDLSRLQLARNQDFLALYNKTENMKRATNDHFQKLENEQTMSFKNITHLIKKVKDDIVQNETVRHYALEKRLTEMNRTVALTACANYQNEKTGYIVKFPTLKYKTGITDISSFTTTGKFTCEHAGIYLITVTITSYTTLVGYYIRVNGNAFTGRYIDYDSDTYRQTSTASLVYNLKINDTVWVEESSDMYVSNAYSCFTIVKIR